MADAIITRAEARAQGSKRYFTGKACKRGHVAERYVSNLECVVCIYDKGKARAWHKHNKDRHNLLSRKWKQANRDKTRESWARYRTTPEAAALRELYYHTNKELFKALKARRRALQKGAPGTHTAADLRMLLAAQTHRCAYCKADLRKVKRHLDHIIPLARGGSNDKENLQYLCAPCNQSKGAKDPIQFAREQGRLL